MKIADDSPMEISEADVHDQIKKALHRQAEEDANNIKVQVDHGRVVLSGKVHSWSEKNEAEWAAFTTDGVRSVKNNVRVNYN